MFQVALLFFILFFIGNAAAQPLLTNKPTIQIDIAVSTNIRRAFLDATETTPCYFLSLEQIKKLYLGELEMVIACKALYAAGVVPHFIINPTPNYSRSLYMVENGDVHMSAETVWFEEINNEKMLHSKAVITKDVLEKGVYALEGHPIFDNPDVDLTQYRGTTVNNWFKDVAAIKEVTENVYLTYRYSSIYIMLQAKRVDFTLLAFPSSDNLNIIEDEGTFKPVSNIKVQLAGNRHFIVSKRRKKGQLLLRYLDKGIELMRQNGELQQIFYASGIINEKVKDWEVIN